MDGKGLTDNNTPGPPELMLSLNKLMDEAEDLMSSQQAMPDDGSLTRLRNIVAEAYRLGRLERRQPE